MRYRSASSSLSAGHASRKIASSGSPLIAPTRANSSAGPPWLVITMFAVSTTKRTLSVSVPSRSQRTARRAGPGSVVLAAALARGNGDGLDRQGDLLGDAAVAGLLASAHERRELVVEGVDVLEPRVDDLEPQVPERIALREPFEDKLTDPLGRHLRDAALAERRLELIDEPVDLVGGERFGGALADRAGELATVEL